MRGTMRRKAHAPAARRAVIKEPSALEPVCTFERRVAEGQRPANSLAQPNGLGTLTTNDGGLKGRNPCHLSRPVGAQRCDEIYPALRAGLRDRRAFGPQEFWRRNAAVSEDKGMNC